MPAPSCHIYDWRSNQGEWTSFAIWVTIYNFCNPGDLVSHYQGMTPIAKIEIAIPIPIFLRNWDCDPDLNPDINLKHFQRSDHDRNSAMADPLKFSCKNPMVKFDVKTRNLLNKTLYKPK